MGDPRRGQIQRAGFGWRRHRGYSAPLAGIWKMHLRKHHMSAVIIGQGTPVPWSDHKFLRTAALNHLGCSLQFYSASLIVSQRARTPTDIVINVSPVTLELNNRTASGLCQITVQGFTL